MSRMRYNSSNPDPWTMPRPWHDASLRYMKHGPIQPMEQNRGLLQRLFRIG